MKPALLAFALVFALVSAAQAQNQAQPKSEAPVLSGGPKGIVKTVSGDALEGIMVQLISNKSSIRTTVFSNEKGAYEFPKLETGSYTLRIAKPREFHPYVRENIAVDGATPFKPIELKTIAGVTDKTLPPSPMLTAQMNGSEWLQSLPGTPKEKNYVHIYCNFCHSYQQIFRNKYDEQGWANIVYRMLHGAGSPLIVMREQGRLLPEDEKALAAWLARVRGPGAKDPTFVKTARPKGRATKVIITEYEIPRLETALHDVAGDAVGKLWYSPHRSSYIGQLDPKTGKTKEFLIPPVTKGVAPGTHWITVDKNGIVWGSEPWVHNVYRLDPKTGDFKRYHWPTQPEPLNTPFGGNLAIDHKGFFWHARHNFVSQIDPTTGVPIKRYPTKKYRGAYGSALSDDDRYFGGGAWPQDGMIIVDNKTGEVFEPETSPTSGPARGNFDREGNYWSGGRGGFLVKFDTKTKRVHQYQVQSPYASLYTAKADKNNEIWAGILQAGRYLRFNSKTEEMVEYELPEPFGHDREAWIDNSTTPVSVWYVDHDGWLVRLQPLD